MRNENVLGQTFTNMWIYLDVIQVMAVNCSLVLGCTYLLILPLWPKVPWQSCSNAKESEHHEQPQKPINNVEFPVKEVADPMDGAPTCIPLCRLSQGRFLQFFRHVSVCTTNQSRKNPTSNNLSLLLAQSNTVYIWLQVFALQQHISSIKLMDFFHRTTLCQ